jgi:glycoside hydrolase-like protein
MIKIIDTSNETTSRLGELRNQGVECIIRYISTNTSDSKVVKPAEARAIAAAGLKLALVFEVWGGVNNFAHDDIDGASGTSHGNFARDWATNVGAPDGTIVWFAVDTDCTAGQYAQRVRPYFQAARAALQGKYRIGVYACGYVCTQAIAEGLVDATWLTQSMGFNGSRAFRDSGRWTLLQGPETTLEGLSIDTNQANGNDYGAFVPFQAPVTVPVPTPIPVPIPIPVTPIPALASIDWVRLEQDIARLGQIAATLSSVAGWVGRVPTTGLPPQVVQAEQQVVRLGEIAGKLSQYAEVLSGQKTAEQVLAEKPQLSPIDKMLGGEALVGVKTPLAIAGYALMWILQTLGVMGTATGDTATTTGTVLTVLVMAFGGLGITAKFDRAFEALSTIAGLLQKLPALVPPAAPAGGK